MQTVTATELVRNLREVLDAVAISGETVLVERNSVTVAQIVPSEKTMTARQALAGLRLPALSPAQAQAWLHDSKDVFGEGLRDPWE